MGKFLGLRTETVSRQLRRLRATGLIETPKQRSVVVRDLAAIERAAEKGRGRPGAESL
jgi:predicted ArsR family transcriptional regulator